MLLDVVGGPTFDPRPAAIVGGVLLLAGLVLAALSKPSRPLTARMLDRTFGLQERLSTALDDLGLGVPAPGERAPVVYLQMADAANAIAALRNDRRLRPAIPVREVVLVVLCALVLATFAFLRGLGGGLPELAVAHVPPFTPAIERPAEPEPSAAELEAAAMAPTVQEVLERADRSAQARRDLQALAAALADHAVTRPAAEQIARGDYDAAGEQIRDAAAQAGELSQGAREGLAERPGARLGDDAARDQWSPGSDARRRVRASPRRRAGAHRDGAISPTRWSAPANRLSRKTSWPPRCVARSKPRPSRVATVASPARRLRAAMRSDAGAAVERQRRPGSGADAERVQRLRRRCGGRANAARSPVKMAARARMGNRVEGGTGRRAPATRTSPGPAKAGLPGMRPSAGANASAMESEGDSASAQQGAGAGTGEAGDPTGEEGAASAADLQVGMGEDPADANVSTGGAAEADPAALEGANPRVALPSGSGQQGVQTSSDGGSAMRGSGAGVTAGSGFAVQGEVGEAGPDSNRVPAEHRETVERYFSNGGGE